jgi:rhodanese-related sulfurtransferase
MTLAARLRKLLTRPYTTIPASRAQELMQQRRAVLLDVRERSEWDSGHAPNARHIPLGALPGRLDELPTGRPVVAMCQSGLRSARAARLLARQGHEVYNLRGGMRAWVGASLPVNTSGGARHAR